MSQFPQLRKDPIVDRWVLIAPERAARPGALVANADEVPDDAADCPFCEGRELRTPPELFALRDAKSKPNSPGWKVRVVPNQFPAVRGDLGSHELIVECPDHEVSWSAMSTKQISLVLRVIRDRMMARRQEGIWNYGQWFKNHGTAAGASLAHAHSQLLCLQDVPKALHDESAAIRDRHGECVFCKLTDSELADGARIVRAHSHFVAIAAVAGRFPFETWLLPRTHQACFDQVPDESLEALATELLWLLRRLDDVVGKPGYNLVLHNGPWNGTDFHWHYELLPRITGIAGFEIGAGMFINPITPEDAAKRLRVD